MWGALGLLIVACSTIYAGSLLSVGGNDSSSVSARLFGDSTAQYETITFSQALLLPIYASACLIFMYLFFGYTQYIFLFLIIFSSATSLLILTSITVHSIIVKLSSSSVNTTITWIISAILTAATLVEYIRTGNFICHDLLGVSLAVLFILTIRFPNAKIAFLTLSLLLFYDLFWVFFSEYFFKQNVMVEVASKETSNPVHDIGKQLNIESLRDNFSKTLSLPIKLLMPHLTQSGWRYYMLGLGDIAMPGSFVALTYRLDLHYAKAQSEEGDVENKKDSLPPSTLTHPVHSTQLFAYTMLGYALGLCMAFTMSMVFNHAQPALIYIVPGVVLAFVWRAYWVGLVKTSSGSVLEVCLSLFSVPNQYVCSVTV